MLHWFLKKKKDTDTDQTKRNTTDQKKKPTTSPGGGSAHKDQSTGNFTADNCTCRDYMIHNLLTYVTAELKSLVIMHQ